MLRPADWTASVNAAVTAAEEEAVRQCVRRGRPFGGPEWAALTAARLALNPSPRPLGRPGKPDRADQPELF